jgi:hypothetical protein
MNRYFLVLIVGLVSVLLGNAQQSRALPIAQAVRLLERNSLLIETIVTNSLSLAVEKDLILRSESYRPVLVQMQNELLSSDKDRQKELKGLLQKLVEEGLTPSMKAAREKLSPGHPDLIKLNAMQQLIDGLELK